MVRFANKRVWASALLVLLGQGAALSRALAADELGLSAPPVGSSERIVDEKDYTLKLERPSRPLSLGLQWMAQGFFAETRPIHSPKKYFMSLQADAAGELRWKSLGAFADVAGYVGAPDTREYSTFEIRQVGVSFHVIDHPRSALSIHLGRRWQNWSTIDQEYGLGFVEPPFRWDPLRPTRTGLSGAFAEVRIPFAAVTVFGSGLAFPEAGPSATLRNGVFTSANPLYTPPPDSVPLMGEATDMRYFLEMPPVRELVVKPSVGALVEVEAGPVFLRGGYLYKPVAQPVLSLKSQQIFNLSNQTLEAVMRPQTVHHQVGVAELGVKWKGLKASLSTILDSPDQPVAEPGWTTQQLSRGAWLGAHAEYSGLGPALGVSYLHSWGGVSGDVGAFAPGGYQSLFGNRYPYRSALSLSARGTIFQKGQHRLSIQSRWMREFTVGGNWIMADLEYRPWSHFAMMLGTDLIAAGKVAANTGGAGFLSGMSGFDRFRFGFRLDL